MGSCGTHHACSMCPPTMRPSLHWLHVPWLCHGFPCFSSLPLHASFLAPSRSCTPCCAGYGTWRLVLGAVIAALFHCHVVRRWFRHSHGQLLLICGHCACIVCEVQQAAPCMPHANSDFHAHACACTHGFAHPEHLHCCRFAVTYGLGPMLWDRASWRISSSVVPARAIACMWPLCGCLALRTVICTADVIPP